MLYEYYCNGPWGRSIQKINCANGCSNGACISSCKDSDANVNYPDGKNYYKQGFADDRVNSIGSYYNDTCLLRNQTGPSSWQYIKVSSCSGSNCNLQEGFCSNGKVSNIAYSCPNGCEGGVCVKKEIAIDPCNQNNFSLAILVIAKNESEITPTLLSNLELVKKEFSKSFFEATNKYATMDTSYPVKIIVNNTFDPMLLTSTWSTAEVTQKFYESNPDNFDFIAIYKSFDILKEVNYDYNVAIRNYIEGIGSTIGEGFVNTGSKSRLKAITYFKGNSNELNINKLVLYSYNFNGTQNALLHEIGHTWGVYVGDDFVSGKNNAQLEIKQDGIHFYRGLNNPTYNIDALNSDHWIANGDGTFRRINEEIGNPIHNYHPIMLYFIVYKL
ncbi:MAG: hypothetical protein AABW75_05005 [Nanoarchaeota archaeon]